MAESAGIKKNHKIAMRSVSINPAIMAEAVAIHMVALTIATEVFTFTAVPPFAPINSDIFYVHEKVLA